MFPAFIIYLKFPVYTQRLQYIYTTTLGLCFICSTEFSPTVIFKLKSSFDSQITRKKENIQASRMWENERERIAFWKNCDRYFEEHKCTTAGQFFEVIAFTDILC